MSQIRSLDDLPGRRFPAGRLTRVLGGPGAPDMPEGFVLGVSALDPWGAVPPHEHDNEELYLALEGSGTIEIDGEQHPFAAGQYVYLCPGVRHGTTAGPAGMRLLFAYAPAGEVSHWSEELRPEVSR